MCRAIVLQSNENQVTQITQTHSNVLIYFMNLISFFKLYQAFIVKTLSVQFGVHYVPCQLQFVLLLCEVFVSCKNHEAQ